MTSSVVASSTRISSSLDDTRKLSQRCADSALFSTKLNCQYLLPLSLRGVGSYSISAPRTLPPELFSSIDDHCCNSGSAISAADACSLVRVATGSAGATGWLLAAGFGAAARGGGVTGAGLLALTGAAGLTGAGGVATGVLLFR